MENHTGIKLQPKNVHVSANPTSHIFGDNVTVTAVAIGLNAVSYQWLKNDVLLSTTSDPTCRGLGTPKLTIYPFTRDYEGKYVCSVGLEDDNVVKSSYIQLTLSKYNYTKS